MAKVEAQDLRRTLPATDSQGNGIQPHSIPTSIGNAMPDVNLPGGARSGQNRAVWASSEIANFL
eukprot:CAMPEP_0179173674 /NCGR_PEP_ID=MMETSP0796-20121207/85713_1 /TAXON_ID=73915 /ORGANISM="Pyrodinium bahamense, Strain pbaha01" /LENGTH=63 /DNA_ID=CAMNT_0020876915 /DNA_START=543 /DNA_END=734 /DNA_ORIENTATION=-